MSLEIYDPTGRMVRLLESPGGEPGTKVFAWDGKDARSLSIASGVYFGVLRAGGIRVSQRLVHLR